MEPRNKFFICFSMWRLLGVPEWYYPQDSFRVSSGLAALAGWFLFSLLAQNFTVLSSKAKEKREDSCISINLLISMNEQEADPILHTITW